MITLKVHQLMKKYGRQTVFRDLSFTTSVKILGIAGRNGSGKSTLLLCLAGLLKPTNGTIQWILNGNECNAEKLNRNLGYAAPYIELYEGLNCSENLKFLLDLNRHSIYVQTIPNILEQFDAADYSNKNYGELSTGQRQRVKLAASCLHNPSILCLDEPGTNLDKSGKTVIRTITEQFREEEKMVLIASNLEEELELCDEIINLDDLQT